MLSQKEAMELEAKLRDGVTNHVTPTIGHKECAAILGVMNAVHNLGQEANQYKRMATMAVAKAGGFVQFSNEEMSNLTGGLKFDTNEEDGFVTAFYLPSEDTPEDERIITVEDILINKAELEESDDATEWVVLARSPSGGLVLSDNSMPGTMVQIIPVENLEDWKVVPDKHGIIEEFVRNEDAKPKILRPRL